VKVGVMGAGQLGQMLAFAGRNLGFEFRFISPDANAPAGRHAELVVSDYANEAALAHFADGLDVATYEFESIPAEAVKFVAGRVPVYPPLIALETAQDRSKEKSCFERLKIPTAPFAVVDSMNEVRQALEKIGVPAVLKTRTQGYDGKGQAVIRRKDEIANAWVVAKGAPSIVESFVNFSRELSIIGVRGRDGKSAFYPMVENYHSEGILRFSLAPAPAVSDDLQKKAEEYSGRLMDSLGYVGVLALELFQTGSDLVANEMAPRVHNTGHWTIEGADTSQFENHLRAIVGMPLGSTEMGGAAGMINVIGREPNVERLREIDDVHIHMYGKTARPRRKLGHITVVSDSLVGVQDTVSRLRNVMGR
jgi:5-(carboxyamino)imidazole ribonucleotide synthase